MIKDNRLKILLGSTAAFVAIGTGIAIAGRTPPQKDELPDILAERLRPGAVIEQYVAELASTLRAADRASDGLDQKDVDLLAAMTRARGRASAVSQILSYDLDGNFEVTRAEIEQSLPSIEGDQTYRSNRTDSLIGRYDADGNGIITLTEAAATARENNDMRLQQLLALDESGDHRLTAEELRRLAERAFANVDTNRDGKISAEEFAPISERIRDAQMSRNMPRCALPAVPKGAKVYAFGAYEGAAISSTVLGSQDEETNVIDVTIEPGSSPLYLVLTSYESMIWRVSGATGRVAQVVVSASASKSSNAVVPRAPAANSRRAVMSEAPDIRATSVAGVVGLPASKVTIAAGNCPRYFHDVEGPAGKGITATIRRTVGREPEAVFGSYSAQRVSLPSGQITRAQGSPVPAGFDRQMWREANRYWPGGLVRIDPGQVVTKVSAQPYQVLPSQMGLSQLIGAGAIERVANGFRIKRAIPHMPPSMGGAHSVTLILAKGVPLPPGNAVHSCVISEETKRPVVAGPMCRVYDPELRDD